MDLLALVVRGSDAKCSPDRRFACVELSHQLSPRGSRFEQLSRLRLLLFVHDRAVRSAADVEARAAERVADGVASHVVSLGELVRLSLIHI